MYLLHIVPYLQNHMVKQKENSLKDIYRKNTKAIRKKSGRVDR